MRRTDDLNEERMRLLGRHLAELSVIKTVQYFPSGKEDRVVSTLQPNYYPNIVETATLDVRLRLNGEFNMQYYEEWDDERWSCRWDRHPNSHNTDDHYHIPPQPQEERAVDANYPTDPNDVLRLVLQTIETRINEIWSGTDWVYPSEYEFQYEYGSDYLVEI